MCTEVERPVWVFAQATMTSHAQQSPWSDWEYLASDDACDVQAWKSNPHYFCEICRVWMNDNPSARATHEKGAKHQDGLARSERLVHISSAVWYKLLLYMNHHPRQPISCHIHTNVLAMPIWPIDYTADSWQFASLPCESQILLSLKNVLSTCHWPLQHEIMLWRSCQK